MSAAATALRLQFHFVAAAFIDLNVTRITCIRVHGTSNSLLYLYTPLLLNVDYEYRAIFLILPPVGDDNPPVALGVLLSSDAMSKFQFVHVK